MDSALFSKYVIDGVSRELTPAQILGDTKTETLPGQIIDESIDSAPGLLEVDSSKVEDYLRRIEELPARSFPISFAAEFTRSAIAAALIESLFCEGKFKLDDLAITLKWTSDDSRIGNMAAFYHSVEAAADYTDGLGVGIRRYSFTQGSPSVQVATQVSGAPHLVPDHFVPDASSWIVYIPFETSDYRLGGSRLAQALGLGGGSAPEISDPDYFMDCFELVREFVEDGVALSGIRVGGGGLISAVKSLCVPNIGADIDISDLMRASDESNVVRVLFSEVPGVLLQTKDSDFDYLDAECLLQDIAFFPLGHPVTGNSDVRVKSSAKTGIQTILDTLMQNAEGED
ncbi:MAG: hypothetical protein MJY61_03745 [Bacteroidales bacterium]|nr:hypothetical protein [Bacteroidales bacterium]